MLSVSPNCIVRSSLDDMLEALQRRDESDCRRDVPPALPRRTVSRSRPPTAKRRLPVSFEPHAIGESSRFCARNDEMMEQNKIVDPEYFKQDVQHGTSQKVQKDMHKHHDRQHLPELDWVVVTFQSYVRGEIARKDYNAILRLKKQDVCEKNQDHQEMLVEELEKRISMAEAAIELKEKENGSLREQVQQYEARWSEFEAKAKSNEETWQRQIASLQMDLAAAKKRAVAESIIGQPENSEGSKSNAAKKSAVAESIIDGQPEKNEGSISNAVRNGVEMENSNYASPFKKFRGLKRVFKLWTKDCKVRRRDSDTKIHPAGHSEAADGHWKTWWGKKSKRVA